MNSAAGKKEIEKQSWAGAICSSAVVRKRTWPVIVYGAKIQDYQLDA
jgi:hypothetical protein